jgi:aconitate hydratase
MGVLPLEFLSGEGAASLDITGREALQLSGLSTLASRTKLKVTAKRDDGSTFSFDVLARLDSSIEVEYYRNGGILHTVLRSLL